jgi:hypothetical protein
MRHNNTNFSVKNILNKTTPFIQGEMDGLCGLYAIANAVRYNDNKNIPIKKYRSIFETKNLASIFHQGMDDDEMINHLQRCSKVLGFKYSILSNVKDIPFIDVTKNICVIISVEKSNILWDEPHYTVVVGNTPNHYTFYDCLYGHFRVPRELFCFKSDKNKVRIFQKNMFLIY